MEIMWLRRWRVVVIGKDEQKKERKMVINVAAESKIKARTMARMAFSYYWPSHKNPRVNFNENYRYGFIDILVEKRVLK